MYLKALIFIIGGSSNCDYSLRPLVFCIEVHRSYSRRDEHNLGQDVRGIFVTRTEHARSPSIILGIECSGFTSDRSKIAGISDRRREFVCPRLRVTRLRKFRDKSLRGRRHRCLFYFQAYSKISLVTRS